MSGGRVPQARHGDRIGFVRPSTLEPRRQVREHSHERGGGLGRTDRGRKDALGFLLAHMHFFDRARAFARFFHDLDFLLSRQRREPCRDAGEVVADVAAVQFLLDFERGRDRRQGFEMFRDLKLAA